MISASSAAQDGPAPYPPCEKKVTEGDTTAAKGAFEAGNAAFNEADYPRAILYWEDAYRRDCTAHALLLNLSRAYELNGQKRHAVNALTTYDERVPNSPKRSQNEKRVKKLQDAIAADEAAAAAALENQQEQRAAAAVSPAPVAPAPSAPEPPAEEHYTAAHWVSLGGAGLGVVALAIGIPVLASSNVGAYIEIFDPNGNGNRVAANIVAEWGGDAAGAQAAVDALYGNDMPPSVSTAAGQATLSSDALSAATQHNVGLAMTISGAAVAVVGTTLFFVLPKERTGSASASAGSRRATTSIDSVAPIFAPGFAGLGVAGRF